MIPENLILNPQLLDHLTHVSLKDDPEGMYILKSDLQLLGMKKPIWGISVRTMKAIIGQFGTPFPEPLQRDQSGAQGGRGSLRTLDDYVLAKVAPAEYSTNQMVASSSSLFSYSHQILWIFCVMCSG